MMPMEKKTRRIAARFSSRLALAKVLAFAGAAVVAVLSGGCAGRTTLLDGVHQGVVDAVAASVAAWLHAP